MRNAHQNIVKDLLKENKRLTDEVSNLRYKMRVYEIAMMELNSFIASKPSTGVCNVESFIRPLIRIADRAGNAGKTRNE